MKYLALFLALGVSVFGAEYSIDATRITTEWANAGVPGGFQQYRPGGASARPTGSGTTFNVTTPGAIPGSVLFASGSTTTTTGSISIGSNQ